MTAKTTVSKIGEKSVNIRTFDSERTRFTLFLFNILVYWLKNIFFNNKIIQNSNSNILILSQATTHYDNNMIEKFKTFNSNFVLIPLG